jgi:16S rRNA (guanine527-N7)-methyltransferase
LNTDSRLNALLTEAGLPTLDPVQTARFSDYLELILRWNQRLNLTAIRDEEGILRRHFVESIFCARQLPGGVATLLDYGSGAGFPGLPIAICRPEIAVTLAESQGKKAAFLREAIRVLGVPAKVFPGRAEELRERFDCVTLRAVDRMEEATRSGANLVAGSGWLVLMTTAAAAVDLRGAASSHFIWQPPIALPGGDDRQILLGSRREPG